MFLTMGKTHRRRGGIKFVDEIELGISGSVGTGKFGADMKVEILNDGPVTIIIDSKNKE